MYASGAEKLLPLINKELISELNTYKPTNIEEKCLLQIVKKWYEFQEITAKTVNTILLQNKDGLPIIFSQMVKELLIILSYLNSKPYTTLGKYVTEATKFPLKPEGFDELVAILINGEYQDFLRLQRTIEAVLSSLENILKDKNISLYAEKL